MVGSDSAVKDGRWSPARVTATAPVMLKTRLAWLPLTARLFAPGPLIVRALSIVSWPWARVIVPVTPGARVITAPDDAKAIASRNVQPSLTPASVHVPSPSSAVLVTTGPVATWIKLERPGRAGPVGCGASVQAASVTSAGKTASAASGREARRAVRRERLVIGAAKGEGRRAAAERVRSAPLTGADVA